MTPDEIAKSYDQIADLWDSNELQRSNGIEQHGRALAFLKNGRNALDIGCGSSGRFIDLLMSHGFTVEGLDLSDRMIEAESTFLQLLDWMPRRRRSIRQWVPQCNTAFSAYREYCK